MRLRSSFIFGVGRCFLAEKGETRCGGAIRSGDGGRGKVVRGEARNEPCRRRCERRRGDECHVWVLRRKGKRGRWRFHSVSFRIACL